MLKDQLWKLSLLVRGQDRDRDRGQGLDLKRRDRLRRTLDLRVYEILLLLVRTQLLRDGIDTTVLSSQTVASCAGCRSTAANDGAEPLQMLLNAADEAIQRSAGGMKDS